MLRTLSQKKAQSVMEYMFLIVVICLVFIIFQKYITRAISGRWKSSGDALGYGRLYDPQLTTECIFDDQFSLGWYNKACFEQRSCDCLTVSQTPTTCQDCIRGCITSFPQCNQT